MAAGFPPPARVFNSHLVPVAQGSPVGTETPLKGICSNRALYQHPGFSVKLMFCPSFVLRSTFFPFPAGLTEGKRYSTDGLADRSRSVETISPEWPRHTAM